LKYRKFGPHDWTASILGLGTAGLSLDENCTAAEIELIRTALQNGINYINLGIRTSIPQQERAARMVALALQGGFRNRTKVVVSLPARFLQSPSHFEVALYQQLEWLGENRADLCLLADLNRENWPVLQQFGIMDWIEAKLSEGRIGGIGFSFHDHFQVLKRIIGAYSGWSFCQFQFSCMDVDHDPGISGIDYAAQQGLAVVVTGALKNGRLAPKPPNMTILWDEFKIAHPAASALRFVWNQPGVTTVVSSMRTRTEIAENMALAAAADPDCLTIEEEIALSRLRDTLRKLAPIPCPSCRPCMPCPEAIDVPRIFEIYNDAFLYDDIEEARLIYRNEQHHADRCSQCGLCEIRCIKSLKIVEWLRQAHRLLSGSEK
jgi:uncharacterized protein